MSGVCRHRGMIITAPGNRPESEWTAPVPETRGNCRNFKCPYHWWIYDLDGRLVGAPAMDKTPGFERGEIGLPKLRTEVWKGFIFVNFDEDAPPLAPRLVSLATFSPTTTSRTWLTVEPFTVPDLPFNWKVMVENFMEGYHPDRLHSGIHVVGARDKVVYLPYEEADGRAHGYIEATHPDGGSTRRFGGSSRRSKRSRTRNGGLVPFVYVPPSLLLGFQSDSAFWFVVQPTNADTHTLSMAYIFPPSTARAPALRRAPGSAIQGSACSTTRTCPRTPPSRRACTRASPRVAATPGKSPCSRSSTSGSSSDTGRARGATVGAASDAPRSCRLPPPPRRRWSHR